MEADFKNLSLLAHLTQIAKTHDITLKQAIIFYQKRLEIELAENQEKIANFQNPPPSKLGLRLGKEKYNILMEKLVLKCPASSELSQAYYQAKASNRLKQARLKIGGKFHFRNSNFIGEKLLTIGTIVEAEVYDEQLYQIWISPVEREFVFYDELEII